MADKNSPNFRIFDPSALTVRDMRNIHDPAQFNGHSSQYAVDLREIVMAIKANWGNYRNDPQELDQALHRVFTDRDLLLKVFTDEMVLNHILQVHDDFIKQKKKKQDDAEAKISYNGITHKDHDEAVDVIEEFQEMGLDTLDEGQLEIYEENLDIVKQYENS